MRGPRVPREPVRGALDGREVSTYQVRVSAYLTTGTTTSWLSASEDLLGVFTFAP